MNCACEPFPEVLDQTTPFILVGPTNRRFDGSPVDHFERIGQRSAREKVRLRDWLNPIAFRSVRVVGDGQCLGFSRTLVRDCGGPIGRLNTEHGLNHAILRLGRMISVQFDLFERFP